eukprot:c8542_g1_i1.p1 GENE.c8542_g1_i1~~c8542_g1_i1.p1  ORF type:complete len:669 (+),score=156.39 c8542_g1_i1:213-2009(+)
MQESGVPESDIHGEGSEAMVKFQEDALDTGGEGAQMQQSVPSQTVLATEKQEVEEEEDIRVSDDMVPGAAALSTVFQSKSDEINDIRQQLEASKTSVQQQAREAKRLIKEAYGKQAYLRDLQKQLLDQSVSIARQEEQIKLKGMELDKMRAELEDKLKESNQQAAAARAQASMSAAIQTQISELERKSHEVSSTKDVEKSDLVKLKDTLAQMKNEIDAKDKDLSKKETDMKQLFVELSALKKSSERHELFLKQQEQLIKQQQAEIKQKNDELKAREERLNLKTTLESHHHVADLEAKVAPQIALQTAVSVQAAVEKPLSELPLEGSEVIGHVDDLSIADQIAQQPRIEIPKRAPKVVSIPETEVLNVTIVDRSTRSVETKLDSRPPTYGQKLLVGQAYSASFNPTANGERDPDDLCRNSRGEVVDCGLYEAVSKGAVAVPPIVPRAASIGSDSGSVWSDNEYQIESNGPCVLKCAYHKGPTSAAGPRNIEEISIEIPTTVSNNTYACPKTNNGFPFLSCSLLLDGSDKCRSTCVFDGDANPLKPKMLGIGQPFSGPQATKFDLSEFRSLAHTTYTLTTDRGCKSSMKADPLVACEVHL